MSVVAKAHREGDKVIPIPLDFIPSQIKPNNNQNIIVAVADASDGNAISSKVYKFYGKESCKKIIAELPPYEKPMLIFCVSSSCLMHKINDAQGLFPDSDTSPLWTEERYGISANEAINMRDMDEKARREIQLEAATTKKKLEKLSIVMNESVLNLISECRQLIEEAQVCEAKASKECREETAEEVAKFLERNFAVKAWVENLVEPVVAFAVTEEDDNKAYILGRAIDQVLSDIEPEDSRKFFNEFVYDACSWPVVIDRTFEEDGSRSVYPKEL